MGADICKAARKTPADEVACVDGIIQRLLGQVRGNHAELHQKRRIANASQKRSVARCKWQSFGDGRELAKRDTQCDASSTDCGVLADGRELAKRDTQCDASSPTSRELAKRVF